MEEASEAEGDKADEQFEKEAGVMHKMKRLGRIKGEGMKLEKWLMGPLTEEVLLKLKLRVGTNGLAGDQSRRSEGDGLCASCEEEEVETEEHLLAECTAYKDFRTDFGNLLKGHGNGNVRRLGEKWRKGDAQGQTDLILGKEDAGKEEEKVARMICEKYLAQVWRERNERLTERNKRIEEEREKEEREKDERKPRKNKKGKGRKDGGGSHKTQEM
jgi:hypothetical protein